MSNQTDLDEHIAKEKHRRERLYRQKRPYHHWIESGAEEPAVEHWCDYCQGFYGVPHTNMHFDENGAWHPCRFIGRALAGDRQCACIDCMCAEKIAGPGSLASRITQAP